MISLGELLIVMPTIPQSIQTCFNDRSSAISSGLCCPWRGWFKSRSWSDQCDLPFKRNPNTGSTEVLRTL